MTVIRTSEKPIGVGNRPDWSSVTSGGIFGVPVEGGRFDCHYHDCNEYWLIFRGKAKVMTGGKEYYVKAGDVVCTPAGDEHDIIEIYQDLEGFWWEEATPPGGRIGHLHRDEIKAAGHAVASKPLPMDFPE